MTQSFMTVATDNDGDHRRQDRTTSSQVRGATVRPLLVPVTPFEGESLISVIARACEANVFERPALLLALANVKVANAAYTPFTQIDAATSIAKLLSSEPTSISRLTHPRIDHAGVADVIDWYGTPLPRKYVEATRRRVSPTGLHASPHHRAVWMIKALTFCPESLDALIAECPACGERLGWTKVIGARNCENCTGPLERDSVGVARAPIPHRARLAASLVSPDPLVRKKALSKFPAPFQAWHAGDVFIAVCELGFASVHSSEPQAAVVTQRFVRGDFSSFTPRHLAEGVRILSGWPETFYGLVHEIVAHRSGGRHALRHLLGPLGRFVDPLAARTALHQLVTSELSEALMRARAPVKAISTAKISAVAKDEVLTSNEVAKQFSIDKKVLRRLAAIGPPLVHRQGTKFGTCLYDKALIAHAIDTWRNSVPEAKVRSRLKASKRMVDALIVEGLLVEVTDQPARRLANGDRLFSKEVLDANWRRLSRRLIPGSQPMSQAPLGERRRQVSPPTARTVNRRTL